MSYDRVNPDGSITRMPGTYNVKKNKAIFQSTIDKNDRIRAERKKKNDEEIADRSERLSYYFKKLNDNKTVDIDDYVKS